VNISVYTDCGENTAILRIPFHMLRDILLTLPESADKYELISWVRIASSRSKKLRNIVEELGYNE